MLSQDTSVLSNPSHISGQTTLTTDSASRALSAHKSPFRHRIVKLGWNVRRVERHHAPDRPVCRSNRKPQDGKPRWTVSVLCLRALSLCSVSVLCLSDGKRSLTGNLRMLKPAGQRVLLV